MPEFWKIFLDSSQFIPHGHCYLWQPGLVWLHIASNSIIALAYYSIPLMLVYFVHKRRDIPFNGIFILFGIFIVACGTTHLMDIWTLWHPHYWISGFLKAITAAVSFYTALELRSLIPQVLSLPSSAQLEAANQKLEDEIVERQRMEIALRDSQQMLKLVIDTIPQAIFWKDHESVYLGCNRSFALDAGLAASEAIVGRTDYELAWKPEEAEFFQSCDRQFIEANQPEYHIIEPQLQADGKQAWLDSSKIPLHNAAGQVVGILGIYEDITERQIADAALRESEDHLRQRTQQLEQTLKELQKTQSQLIHTEKMSSLGQLVAGIAHEINNPINFIYGNLSHTNEYAQDLLNLLEIYQQSYPHPAATVQAKAEAIDLDFLTEDLPKMLSSMKVGAERIRKIVLSLRNFSRLEESEMKPVDIHEGLDNTLLLLQHRFKEKVGRFGVQVIKKYGPLPMVECYAGQLNQVFMNLIANAIDAVDELHQATTDQSAQPTFIRIETAVLDSNRVVIRIADNGMGMTEAVRQRLFDPFFTTKPVGKGTGLGLSISYQIVTDKHGGELICHSAPGQGTEFRIEIPVKAQKLASPTNSALLV
ncbi:PAS domain-containing protein [Trichocoleus sp. FACHB-591]|uniref:sensor histidine kinase n=1 Tax=Trichocoleus sp. FACHB-591 TaxID=2692872 RepID=UPI00168326F0|nr:ATP-binding protein [Trichocoleus sp. FACHB-591]MBD2095180.1 PAS domain-containing protein [Trichocoleus sp. FACHB-591]